MPNPALNVFDFLARVALEPLPIEILGHAPKLDDEIAREVLGLGLAALLTPQADQGSFVTTHDDPGVGAADKPPPATLALPRIPLHSSSWVAGMIPEVSLSRFQVNT